MTEVFKFYKETNSKPFGHRVYEVSDQGNVKLNGKIVDFSNKTDQLDLFLNKGWHTGRK